MLTPLPQRAEQVAEDLGRRAPQIWAAITAAGGSAGFAPVRRELDLSKVSIESLLGIMDRGPGVLQLWLDGLGPTRKELGLLVADVRVFINGLEPATAADRN